MKPRTPNALVVLVVALVLAAGVGAARAVARSDAPPAPERARIVPAAAPVDLSPCAMGACW